MRRHVIGLAVAAAALPLAAAAQDCAAVGGERVEGSVTIREEAVEVPPFCRVARTLSAAEGSSIGMEIWLPEAEAWNGRLVVVGNGAFAGSVNTGAMVGPLGQGYAVASTDTGHTITTGEFLLEEAQAVDFADRAVHETAREAEAAVEAHYGRAAEFSYFTGCSTGGRQAMTAAQRHPGDFDGIVVGAPAASVTRLQGTQLWEALGNAAVPGGALTAEDFALLHEDALLRCDALDGVEDRVIENPLACEVDPAAVAGLTEEEAAFAARIYQGPTAADGSSIYPGLPPGSEAGWQFLLSEPLPLALDTYRYGVHRDAAWNPMADPGAFDLEAELRLAQERLAERFDVVDPDLSAFAAEGGRLLMYHGWADPGITALSSVAYFEDVQETMGEAADEVVRLFMVPGMGHCSGGEGPSSFDMLSALDGWVTSGEAPESVLASRVTDGVVDRTRPLCPYPSVAAYSGSGDTNDAANFTCQ